MSNKEIKRNIIEIIVITAVAALAVIRFDYIVWVVKNALSVIAPFLIGGVMAFILNIPMTAIEKKLFRNTKENRTEKLARTLSILITFILFAAVIITICFTVIPQVKITVQKLSDGRVAAFMEKVYATVEAWFLKYPIVLEQIQKIENASVDWNEVVKKVFEFLGNGIGSEAIANTFSVAGSIIGGVVNVFIALVFSVYILASKEKLGVQFNKLLKAFLPEKICSKTIYVLKLVERNFRNYISGQTTEAIILGLLFFIVMSIGGFPYALLISLLISVLSLIPIVGAFIGCFIGAFLILVDDPMKALWFVILFLIIQQIEGNLIYPKVVGDSVGLPAMWVLAAVTVGGSLFGVAGMLVFIPLVSAIYALLSEVTNYKLAKKGLLISEAKKNEVVKESKEDLSDNKDKKAESAEDSSPRDKKNKDA